MAQSEPEQEMTDYRVYASQLMPGHSPEDVQEMFRVYYPFLKIDRVEKVT